MQRGPMLLYGAIALVVIGLILLVVWLMGPNQPLGADVCHRNPDRHGDLHPHRHQHPDPDVDGHGNRHHYPYAHAVRTFDYIIQEGDTLPALAERFNLGDDGVLLITGLQPGHNYQAGRHLLCGTNHPNPAAQAPSAPPPRPSRPTCRAEPSLNTASCPATRSPPSPPNSTAAWTTSSPKTTWRTPTPSSSDRSCRSPPTSSRRPPRFLPPPRLLRPLRQDRHPRQLPPPLPRLGRDHGGLCPGQKRYVRLGPAHPHQQRPHQQRSDRPDRQPGDLPPRQTPTPRTCSATTT
ncbi:MAG: hypothetical protein MZV64_17705 [Ignavibacteriales bacterium]|nr:hypothetical protein [Ignavibacteriales bacterium]